jgi:hypothetical protein
VLEAIGLPRKVRSLWTPQNRSSPRSNPKGGGSRKTRNTLGSFSVFYLRPLARTSQKSRAGEGLWIRNERLSTRQRRTLAVKNFALTL